MSEFRGQQLLDLSSFSGTSVGRRSDAPYRVIDPDNYGLIAEVTVEEDHEDELTITEHPVEFGAAITDHAYKRPSELRLRVGWSNAYAGDVRTVYENIIRLQLSRMPFSIYTGKRAYSNMLIAGLRTQTNSGLEFSFLADVTFRQIILVSTQTLPMASDLNNLGFPDLNSGTTNTGELGTITSSLTDNQTADAGADQDFSG